MQIQGGPKRSRIMSVGKNHEPSHTGQQRTPTCGCTHGEAKRETYGWDIRVNTGCEVRLASMDAADQEELV